MLELLRKEGDMPHPVVIVDYDPRWPIIYEEEKRRILEAVGDRIVAIEHIGSTAVPNLGAKPIIDIIAAVRHLSDAQKCIEPLRSIGYEYVPEHETTIPERRYFRKGHPPKERHYHLHMVERTSEFWERHLLFRDYLRTHPKAAQEYYELKKRLAAKHGSDRASYTDSKTLFIESVITKTQNYLKEWHKCMERDFTDEKNLIAPCGNFCGSCNLYRCAPMEDTEGQKRLAEWFNEHFPQYHFEPEGMECIPCRENFERCWSPDCEVYKCCVKERKLDFCYECDDFPCERLKPHRRTDAHNLKVYNLLRIKKTGWREWVRKQKEDIRELHARY